MILNFHLLSPRQGRSYLPCRSVTHTENKHGDDEGLVNVSQEDKQAISHAIIAERAVSGNRKRVGKDIERKVDVGLQRRTQWGQ